MDVAVRAGRRSLRAESSANHGRAGVYVHRWNQLNQSILLFSFTALRRDNHPTQCRVPVVLCGRLHSSRVRTQPCFCLSACGLLFVFLFFLCVFLLFLCRPGTATEVFFCCLINPRNVLNSFTLVNVGDTRLDLFRCLCQAALSSPPSLSGFSHRLSLTSFTLGSAILNTTMSYLSQRYDTHTHT